MASGPASVATQLPVPLDIRKGLTTAEGVNHELRWGLIGTGGISSDWAKCLKKVPGAVLQSVAARSSEKAAAFASKHGMATHHDSYGALVADPSIDIVYVGTITSLHKEHAMLAINAGKHCLCEKPLAETAEDAQLMYQAAEKAGVMLLEGMWARYFPAMEHARLMVEEGVIGDVSLTRSDFPDRCYAAQLAPFVFGTNEAPSSVVAACNPEGVGGAVIQYAERGCAMFSFPSWASEYPESFELIGSKGRITLDQYGHCPTRLTVHTCPAVCWEEPQGHTSTSQNGVPPYVQQYTYPVPEPAGYPAPEWHYTNQHGFVYQAEAVHRCLAAGLTEVPQYTKADSLQVMEILDRINEYPRIERLQL